MIKQETIVVKSDGRGFIDITSQINQVIQRHACDNGLCNLFIKHTSASIIICENADPQVQKDLENFIQHLIPDGNPLFKHIAEGPDDMSAHVRSVLTQSSLSIPIQDQKLQLGQWQGVYLWEHRYKPYQREIVISML